MKKLLILGETGQLAKALSARVELDAFGSVQVAGRSSIDLTKRGAVSALIRSTRPTHIINAAAFTNVDGAEREQSLATLINKTAAQEAAAACLEVSAKFIHVSTDYVFGAMGTAPYDEDFPPSPLNAYGQSKLDGENAALEANPSTIVVRTSALFSGRGRDFPSAIWAKTLASQELQVVSDQLVCPTFVEDLAGTLLKLAHHETTQGIFHYAGQPSTSWFDFAREAVLLLDPSVTVAPITSDALTRPANRPADSRLSCQRLERLLAITRPDWRGGLRAAFKTWKTLQNS